MAQAMTDPKVTEPVGRPVVDPTSGFLFDRLSAALWHQEGLRAFLRYRDIGVKAATAGRMRAEHIQALAPVTDGTGWHCHDLDFQFVYVLAGEVVFSTEMENDIVLRAGDCAHIPPHTMHDETSFTEDFEVLEITLPAVVTTLTARPEHRGDRPDTAFVVSRLGPDSFIRGEGPSAFLEYRELGVTVATYGQVAAQVVRANSLCDQSTGWDCPDLDAHFIYVMNGWLKMSIAGFDEFCMEPGDAMLVPPDHAHRVIGFAADFEVLEINLPAKFETVSVPSPSDAARGSSG